MLVVLHISIQRTSIFKKLLLAYGEDINIFVFDSKAPNWDNFQALTSSSSVTTRQCSNEFSIALAAPSVPRRRGSLPLSQESMSNRGTGTLRRSQEGSTAPLRYLRAHEQD